MSASSAAGSAQDPWLFHGPAASRGTSLPPDAAGLPDAVLFDRDGTLVVDVPYNGDPARVVPMPSAVEALAAVRALGIRVGVVSNQSGVARGMLTHGQVAAVQRRVDAFLGPFDIWAVCPHGPDDGCRCRKPAPGLVLAACEGLGVCPARTAVIGDIGSDVDAALAAGARGVLVPTPATRPEEIAAAPDTAPDLLRAVRLVLDPSARCHRPTAPPRHRSAATPPRSAPARGPAPGSATPGASVATGNPVTVRAGAPGSAAVAGAVIAGPAGTVRAEAPGPVSPAGTAVPDPAVVVPAGTAGDGSSGVAVRGCAPGHAVPGGATPGASVATGNPVTVRAGGPGSVSPAGTAVPGPAVVARTGVPGGGSRAVPEGGAAGPAAVAVRASTPSGGSPGRAVPDVTAWPGDGVVVEEGR